MGQTIGNKYVLDADEILIQGNVIDEEFMKASVLGVYANNLCVEAHTAFFGVEDTFQGSMDGAKYRFMVLTSRTARQISTPAETAELEKLEPLFDYFTAVYEYNNALNKEMRADPAKFDLRTVPSKAWPTWTA